MTRISKAQKTQNLKDVVSVFHWAEQQWTLGFWTSRKIVKSLEFDGHTWQVGWMHDPLRMTRHRVALGIFPSKNTFVPVAVADTQGRIYEVSKLDDDLADLTPRVHLLAGGAGKVRHSRFAKTAAADKKNIIDVTHGSVIARSEDGKLRWLSSWLEYKDRRASFDSDQQNRYSFEQVRSASVAREETANLSYREALVIAYFVLYVQPTLALKGRVIGFGTSNIYRRLRSQAPLSAIRTSVDDITAARKQGMNVSGLEDFFVHLMDDAGALKRIESLEATHAQENLELMTNPQSHLYYLHSRNGVDFDAALTTLRIEANLNRFSAVSSVIENNYHYDFTPTEDFISMPYVAKLSNDLLENPAFDALSTLETNGVTSIDAAPSLRYVHDEGTVSSRETSFASNWLGQFYATARKEGTSQLDDIAHINAAYPLVEAARHTAAAIAHMNAPFDEDESYDPASGAGKSEWLYRQTMAQLITHVRLPIRSDIDFRSNIGSDGGRVAIDFTSSALTVMPGHKYDAQKLEWVKLSDLERKQMASRYNLRVGLMLAAFAFGASAEVDEVALRIDNLYSAQDIEDRDPVAYSLLMRVLDQMAMNAPSSRAQSDDGLGADAANTQSSKAQPKDGDVHGAPSSALLSSVTGAQRVPMTSDASRGSSQGGRADAASDDDTFMNLMNSIDFTPEQREAFATQSKDDQPSDEEVDAAFDAVTHPESDDDNLTSSMQRVRVMSGPGTDPLELIRRTALSNTAVTVVFTRSQFLELLKVQGLENPYDFYHHFAAHMMPDEYGVLQPIGATQDMRDLRYTAAGSHEEPELSDKVLDTKTAQLFGTEKVRGLSIQRNDLLEGALADIVAIASDENLSVAGRAEKIAHYIDDVADPELLERKESYVRSVIDGNPIDRSRFSLASDFENVRTKSREMFMSGDVTGAFELIEDKISALDDAFSAGAKIPLYFNSYAERVVYNKLFANPHEKLVLIPDNLFQTHMEMVEVYSHMNRPDDVLRHLNIAVSYAPAYPLPHLRLAVMLAEQGDWQSSFAAASNALRVALDRDDVAYAYYRMAYAAWMQDQFDIAAACYVVGLRISDRSIPAAPQELEELAQRAASQDIRLPLEFNEAVDALAYYDIDFWPHTKAADMMDICAKAAIDNHLFVPGRTLSVAAARIAGANAAMDDPDTQESNDVVQFQFIRSLNA